MLAFSNLRNSAGATLIEYTLIAALLAMGAMVSMYHGGQSATVTFTMAEQGFYNSDGGSGVNHILAKQN